MHAPALLLAAALAFPSAPSTPARASTTAGALAPSSSSTPATTPSSTNPPSTTAPAATVSEAPIPVIASNVPPAGRRLSANRVLAIAEALPKMRAVRAKYPDSYGGAYLKGPVRWQVSFFSKNGAKEIGQVIIADATGRVLEQWTGFQVAWSMARGYPGAFGRHVNALYIWLPLCVLFLLPFIDPRRPLQLLHLDLLVLLSFGVSLAFFNHARIYASVPLAYPPLLYLLARMLWLLRPHGAARAGARAPGSRSERDPSRSERGSPRPEHPSPRSERGWPRSEHPSPRSERGSPRSEGGPLKLLFPLPWVALGVVFLLGFRIALNVTDSNVIDVGYAGVIGAQKVVDGRALYGHWPQDNEHGDTYGPVSYEAYVPFEQLFGWSGTWDDLPAAHAAAIVFDLLALALIFLLGLRIRGPTLAVALAYAWVSYPFTLFTLESNSNDTLVAVLILAALLMAGAPPVRALRKAGSGAFAALAGLTKFAPLALAPVLATYGLGRAGPEDLAGSPHAGRDGGPRGAGRPGPRGATPRGLAAFVGAFALTAALVSIPALSHDSLRTIYERTIEYQANRGSPFSVWGLYGWHGAEHAVQAVAVALALGLAFAPRRPDLVGLAAACAAIVIATQLGIEHWFYLYIPWFFPLVMVALLGARAGIPNAPPSWPHGWAGEPAAPPPAIEVPLALPALALPAAGREALAPSSPAAPLPAPDREPSQPMPAAAPLPGPAPKSSQPPAQPAPGEAPASAQPDAQPDAQPQPVSPPWAPAPDATSAPARLRLPSGAWRRSG